MEVVAALGRALTWQTAVASSLGAGELWLPSACDGWTIRDVLVHSLATTAKFTEFALGATDRPRTPRHDLLGDDHRLAVRDGNGRALRAWAGVDPHRSCELPFGTFPAATAAGINLFDVLAHTWDVAAGAGIGLVGGDDLWARGLRAARAVIGDDRDLRHFGPELAVGQEEPPQTRFLAYLGRAQAAGLPAVTRTVAEGDVAGEADVSGGTAGSLPQAPLGP